MKLWPRKNWFEALHICELCMPNVNLLPPNYYKLQPRPSLNFSLHHRQPQNDVGTILIFILMEHLSDTPCDDLGVVFQSDDQFFLGTRFQCVRSENLLIHQDDASLFLTNILNLNTCLLDLADLSW